MQRVKVHPHKTKVNSGETECVSVTPDEPGGHAYYRGTVVLSDARFRIHTSGVQRARREQVRNVHAWCVGSLTTQSGKQRTDAYLSGLIEGVLGARPLAQVTYHYQVGRFMTLDGVDVTDMTFDHAVCRGRDFFVTLPA